MRLPWLARRARSQLGAPGPRVALRRVLSQPAVWSADRRDAMTGGLIWFLVAVSLIYWSLAWTLAAHMPAGLARHGLTLGAVGLWLLFVVAMVLDTP